METLKNPEKAYQGQTIQFINHNINYKEKCILWKKMNTKYIFSVTEATGK